MTRRLMLLRMGALATLGPVLARVCQAQAVYALRLGVMPYVSPARLVEVFTPLKVYLGEALGQPVSLATAPDLGIFDERTRAGEYDLVITAPHLARKAEKLAGLQRVAMSSNTSRAMLVALRSSPLRNFAGLRGQTLVMPSRHGIIHQMTLKTLADAGIDPVKDLKILETSTHNNALEMVLKGESDAAAFGEPTWESQTDAVRAKLHVLGRSEVVPGFMVMAHPAMSAERVSVLQQVLRDLSSHATGPAYFKASGLKAFVPVNDAAMRQMDAFIRPQRGS